MSVTQGGYQGITIYNGTTEFVSTRGIRDVSVSIEPEYVDLANGLRRPIAYRRTVSLTIVDHSIYDQLVTWAEALTAVQFVLVGQSKCLQGYDDTYINLVDQFTPFGDVNGFRIELVNTKYSPTWYTNTNLAWYAGWFDGDADNLPDSGEGTPSYEYSKTQTNITLTQSFNTSTSEFTVEIDTISNATNNAKLLLDIPFPFPGATVTFSADITDNTTGATVSVGLNPLNASGSGLGLVSTAVTANGRVSLTTTLPASTYYLRIFPVQIFNATIGVSELTQVTVKYPTLRVDGISAETLY
jgi:hypothetical protein